jgi:hypothetical protein
MFWYVILMLFSPLYLMFGLVLRSEQARVVMALHHLSPRETSSLG